MDAILQLLNQLLPDLLTLLALVVIFYVRRLVAYLLPKAEAWLNAHTTAKQREMIADLSHEAFAYAETVYRSKTGADKLNEALKYFNSNMSKYGLQLSPEAIRAAVERAWLLDNRQEMPVLEVAELKTAGRE